MASIRPVDSIAPKGTGHDRDGQQYDTADASLANADDDSNSQAGNDLPLRKILEN